MKKPKLSSNFFQALNFNAYFEFFIIEITYIYNDNIISIIYEHNEQKSNKLTNSSNEKLRQFNRKRINYGQDHTNLSANGSKYNNNSQIYDSIYKKVSA